MNPALLRTRLLLAAQRFANDVADAVVAASAEEPEAEAEPAKRAPRRRAMRPPPLVQDVSEADERAGLAALAKLGVFPGKAE